MVEQGTHKPLDVGSNPTLATLLLMGKCGRNPHLWGVKGEPRPGDAAIERERWNGYGLIKFMSAFWVNKSRNF